MMQNTEILIIGAGPAGYVAAIRAAQLGKKVTLVENDLVGGVCLNRGCIPTKALLHDTKIISEANTAEKNGIKYNKPEIDYTKFNQHIKNIITRLRKGTEYLLRTNNVQLTSGTAQFVDNNTISISTLDSAEQIFNPDCTVVAAGSKQSVLPNLEPDRKDIITSDEALDIVEIPKNLVIIGAGVVGLEFATIYQRLGSKVSIIEIMDQILPGTDTVTAQHLMQIMKKQGIEFLLKTKITKITKNGKIEIHAIKDNKEQVINTDKILIAVGRVPNTDNLGLKNTDIELTDKRFIKVDDTYQSVSGGSIKPVYAIGDIIGQPLLAHKAMAQGVFIAEKICGLADIKPPIIIPNCIYTDPELSTIGLSESEAQARDYEITIGNCPLSAIGRAHTLNQIDGFVKIVVDRKTKLILGAQILAPDASNLINEIALAMTAQLTIDKIIDTVHPHPTLSEAIEEACAAVYKKSIHTINK
jgi:dihydrolipoamide dehydrogenase